MSAPEEPPETGDGEPRRDDDGPGENGHAHAGGDGDSHGGDDSPDESDDGHDSREGHDSDDGLDSDDGSDESDDGHEDGEPGVPSWSPDEDAPARRRPTAFPTFACTLGPPKAAARSLVRSLFFLVLLLASLALWAHDHGHAQTTELSALAALVALALAQPANELARRVASYPDRCALVLARSGFRLPWLGEAAPGPEGPWEALRGFRVRRGPGLARILILEVAAGRFPISDRSIGSEAFEAAVAVLERALGPEGVLLGSVARLPLHLPDRRSLWARVRPGLPSVGLTLAFLGVATGASTALARVLASACTVAWLAVHFARAWERPPSADLALALDGVVAPLPEDPRRAIKVPYRALRKTAVVEVAKDSYSFVIEHERGRLVYPLEWLDPRHARDFARALAELRE